MYRGALAPVLPVLAVLAGAPQAQSGEYDGAGILAAEFVQPTGRYDHGVLGDALEWGGLELKLDLCPQCAGVRVEWITLALPETRVFEDIAPRLADLDGDRRREVVVVETDLRLGASLAVYDAGGKRATTPFLGAPHRWLAPAGIADFDGDGRVEIAYVDRPHVLGDLVFVRLEGGELREIARLPGLSNHRIGDDFISGGLRDCGTGPELVLADRDWRRVMLVGWAEGPAARDGGAFSDGALAAALDCR